MPGCAWCGRAVTPIAALGGKIRPDGMHVTWPRAYAGDAHHKVGMYAAKSPAEGGITRRYPQLPVKAVDEGSGEN
jgi:hypothetical protein